jgi:hypothetical protein
MFKKASEWRIVPGYKNCNYDLDFIDIRRQVAIREVVHNGKKITKAVNKYRKQWILIISQVIPHIFEPAVVSVQRLDQPPISSLYEQAQMYKKTRTLRSTINNMNAAQPSVLSCIEQQPVETKPLQYSKYVLPRDLSFKYLHHIDPYHKFTMPNVDTVNPSTLSRRAFTDRARTQKQLARHRIDEDSINMSHASVSTDAILNDDKHANESANSIVFATTADGTPALYNVDTNECTELPSVRSSASHEKVNETDKEVYLAAQLTLSNGKFDFADQSKFNMFLDLQMQNNNVKNGYRSKMKQNATETQSQFQNDRHPVDQSNVVAPLNAHSRIDKTILSSSLGGGTYKTSVLAKEKELKDERIALNTFDAFELQKLKNETPQSIRQTMENHMQQPSKPIFVSTFPKTSALQAKVNCAIWQADFVRDPYLIQPITKILALREGKKDDILAFEKLSQEQTEIVKKSEFLKYTRDHFETFFKPKLPFKGVARSSSRLGQINDQVPYEVDDKLRTDELWYKGYKERETESRLEMERKACHHPKPMQIYFKKQAYFSNPNETSSVLRTSPQEQYINTKGGGNIMFRSEILDGRTAFYEMLSKTKAGRMKHEHDFKPSFHRLKAADKNQVLGQQFSN